ncbi:serine/threonine-protein kinase RsbW/sigma-B regulation protein RsbU (phosphoserine phosphatase) [Ectothiorhodosinus mongolicus]|uniref:Serine/threonine-protein kinase RsbW/sigma-B regulation protein RsbU (Phosphoserine phosphatase) n=1 Tax=Ectothiorhodosinus mongolicus TaxID=233100 RepID=A0A1R3VM41_9GAMM|nr:ATP-binding protein [Ectothiorhodosinus mongolicus]ULX57785.1 ATP-binding protein [Ectothiorhodosinus mongolicus]SIT65649.1 serine/threonine-protein kinase RsbW/sigma-B regulation protein RsbU (phosphoserine phosphatase) [Ectothiorhodosinus mongolicus]
MSHEFTLSNDIAELPGLAESIETFGEQGGLSPKVVYALNLVLDEWLTNLISYAYESDTRHEIHVLLHMGDEEVVLEVKDDGEPFNPLTQAPEAPTTGTVEDRPIGGLGLHLLKSLMDEVNYESIEGWNTLRLTKSRA